MLTLTLLRHAKSSWENASLADIDRPLNERGREAAPRMALRMRDAGPSPDLILCSTALRTRQTLDLMCGAHPGLMSIPVTFDAGLYMASADELLAVLRAVPVGIGHLMIIGHNPGMHDLAVALVNDHASPHRRDLERKFPTAAMAVIEFGVDRWRDVRAGKGFLRLFVKPRDLGNPASNRNDP